MAYEEYNDNIDFMEFVLHEAERTLVHATVEELAEFGFGSIEAAVAAYEERDDS